MGLLDFFRDFAFLIALLAVIGFLLVWAELKGGDRDERKSSSTELPTAAGGDRPTTAMPERTPPPSAPRAPSQRPSSSAPVSGPVRRPGNDPRRGQ